MHKNIVEALHIVSCSENDVKAVKADDPVAARECRRNNRGKITLTCAGRTNESQVRGKLRSLNDISWSRHHNQLRRPLR